MRNARRGRVLFFGMWMIATGSTARSESSNLVVLAYAEPGTQVTWLPLAQTVTEKVFAQAGIGVFSIDGGSGVAESRCDTAPETNEFVIRLQARRLDPASHACGVSLRPDALSGHYVTFFLDCIRGAADDLVIAEPIVAAYSIAHEIGHLLLRPGHAPTGIMRARLDRRDWQRAARGALRFRQNEEKEMRTALRARASCRHRRQS